MRHLLSEIFTVTPLDRIVKFSQGLQVDGFIKLNHMVAVCDVCLSPNAVCPSIVIMSGVFTHDEELILSARAKASMCN